MMSRIFLYVRFSSDEQKNGDSESRQLRKAVNWCEINKRIISKTFFDRGVSAFRGDNRTTGVFSELESEVGMGDTILIENQDRFGRDGLVYALPHLHRICNKGVTVIFLDGNTVTTKENFNDDNVLFPNVLNLIRGNKENARKADLVGRAWHAKKLNAANTIVTAMAPAWLDVKVDKEGRRYFEPNDKAETVRRIFKEYSQGIGIRKIVRKLNTEGVHTHGRGKQNKNKNWAATQVRRILGYRQVLGEYQPCRYVKTDGKVQRIPDGDAVPNYYPPIIEKPLFYRVAPMLAKATGRKGEFTGGQPRGRTGNATNLFKGFIKCRYCGGQMWIKRSGKQREYSYTSLVCSNAVKGCCENKKWATIQYSHVERAVLTVLFSKILPELSQHNGRAEKLIALRGELNLSSAHIAQMTEDYEKDPSNLIAKALARKEARQSELTREIEALTATIDDDSILARWEPVERTLENRLRLGAILKQEVESLLIDPHGLQAILTLKSPACSFFLSWERKNGNHLQKNSASERFTMEGECFKPQLTPYMDEVFVWASEHNKGKVFEIKFRETAENQQLQQTVAVAA